MMRQIDIKQTYLPANPSAPASLQARRSHEWVGDVLEATDAAYTNYNALERSVRGNFGNGSSGFAGAVFSKALDDAASEQDAPQNLYNLDAGEYGLSSLNRKYVVKVGGQTQVAIIERHSTLIRTNNGLLNGRSGAGWFRYPVVCRLL